MYLNWCVGGGATVDTAYLWFHVHNERVLRQVDRLSLCDFFFHFHFRFNYAEENTSLWIFIFARKRLRLRYYFCIASKASVICLRMLNAMHWNKYPLLLDCDNNLAIVFMSLHLQYPKYFVVRFILMKLIQNWVFIIYFNKEESKNMCRQMFLSSRTTLFLVCPFCFTQHRCCYLPCGKHSVVYN